MARGHDHNPEDSWQYHPEIDLPFVEASRLEGVLMDLEDVIRRRRLPVVDMWRDGLAPERVRSVLRAAEAPLHDDLVRWWSWHDGATSPTGPPYGHYYDSLFHHPLAVAIEIWREMVEDFEGFEQGVPLGVPPHFFPILVRNVSSGFLLDATSGQMVRYHVEWGLSTRYRWPNLATLASDWVRMLSSGRGFFPGEVPPWPPD